MDQDVKVQLDSIESEVKEHTKILASVDKTLALQAQQLDTHMRRTEAAEENIALLRKAFEPLERRHAFIDQLLRMFAIGGGLAAAIYYCLQIAHLLGKI